MELKKKSKLRVTGLCARNSPVTGEFLAQMASHAENASIWWRHHDEVLTIRSLGNKAMWCSLDQSTRILPAGCCMKGWHQGANVSPMARNSVVGFTIPVINCTMKDESGPQWLKRKCSHIVEIFVTELCILITVISHEHRQTDCLFNILFKEKNFKTHYYWFFVWESIDDELISLKRDNNVKNDSKSWRQQGIALNEHRNIPNNRIMNNVHRVFWFVAHYYSVYDII